MSSTPLVGSAGDGMLFVVMWLVLCAGVVAWLVVLDWRDGQAERVCQQQERLRVQHERFMAERRLQHLTQAALQNMLDAGRETNPRTERPHPGEWFRP